MRSLLIGFLFFLSFSKGQSQDTLKFYDGRVVVVHLVSVTYEYTFFTTPPDILNVTRISNAGLEQIVVSPNNPVNIDEFHPKKPVPPTPSKVYKKIELPKSVQIAMVFAAGFLLFKYWQFMLSDE